MTGRRALALGAILWAAPGCAFVDARVEPLEAPSREAFSELAGPILEERCCDARCHAEGRPYALYAVGRRRIDPADTYAHSPLTEAEVDANWRATLGFVDAPRGRETTLVRKALAEGGPGDHRGGAIFEAPSDPECVAIIGWIEGRPW